MYKIEKIRKVIPGDVIHEKGFKCHGIVDGVATILGTLCRIEDLYFIMSKTKAYVPKTHDIIIGKVIYASQDYFKVNLGSCTGILPSLSFQNATKKNRPDIEKDDFVLCQIEKIEAGEALLSCKKEGLGKIDECFPVDSWKIRLFYFNDFLKKISANRNFKIALGMNGFVWIDGSCETKKAVLKEIEMFPNKN